jgi:hypothetical protein
MRDKPMKRKRAKAMGEVFFLCSVSLRCIKLVYFFSSTLRRPSTIAVSRLSNAGSSVYLSFSFETIDGLRSFRNCTSRRSSFPLRFNRAFDEEREMLQGHCNRLENFMHPTEDLRTVQSTSAMV